MNFKKPILIVSLIFIYTHNTLAVSSLTSPPGELDLLTTYDCIHEDLVTGEIEYYGIVDEYFSECPIYSHKNILNNNQSVSNQEYDKIIWYGREFEQGYPAQAIHPMNNTVGAHDCQFGLVKQPLM